MEDRARASLFAVVGSAFEGLRVVGYKQALSWCNPSAPFAADIVSGPFPPRVERPIRLSGVNPKLEPMRRRAAPESRSPIGIGLWTGLPLELRGRRAPHPGQDGLVVVCDSSVRFEGVRVGVPKVNHPPPRAIEHVGRCPDIGSVAETAPWLVRGLGPSNSPCR